MKMIKLFLITSAVLMANVSFAADAPNYVGAHQHGFVSVNAAITSMQGLLNVRSHPAPGHETSYVYTHHYANNVVWFQGLDAVTNRFFACVVPITDPLYNQAVAIQNNSQEGARLLLSKSTTSSNCTRIGLSNGSRYIQ